MDTLSEAREKIDAIDRQMASLFEARLKAVEAVAAWKIENNLPVLDASREAAVIEKNRKYIENPGYRDMYETFLQFIMDQSKNYQKSLSCQDVVAYAGIKGAFSHMVSEKLFSGYPKLAKNSFEEVIQAVIDRQARYGVIPFENTNSGLVGEVLDALLEYPVYITGVEDQHIEQCLLGLPQATLKDIEWVYSKDQALNQAREFLDSLGVKAVPYPNTAMAAQYVASQQDPAKAAIGAKENALLYNLKILASHIEANASNTTRFLIIENSPSPFMGDHCSFIVTASNEVGSLAKIIEVISRHNLNMDCIQSRPIKNKPFEYFFYIQCFGQMDQDSLASCFGDLESVCSSIKWMGSYSISRR